MRKLKSLICFCALSIYLSTIQAETNANDFKRWVNEKGELVKKGEMKHSAYYKGWFNILLDNNSLSSSGKTNMLKASNLLIDASLEFESGAITEQQFQSKKREAMIVWQMRDEPNEPAVEYHRRAPEPEPEKKSTTNCISTRSANSIFTNCY